jgi:site-specific DNA recombinase
MEVALDVRVSTTRQPPTQTREQPLARLRAHGATQPDGPLAEAHSDRDDGERGAKLKRPGLDRRRDRAALAAFARVLLTAPDRLARNAVQPLRRIDALAQRGWEGECLDRPMRPDPHDQLLLQSRGAVAEDERTLITDRMRRGHLLPWRPAPSGDVRDPEPPRDPQRLRLEPVKAAVITQIWAWSTDPQTPATLEGVAQRLTDDQIPTPRGGPRGTVASVRGLLRSPVYTGPADRERPRPVPARLRRSAWRPGGPGSSHRPAPPEAWIAIPGPAIVSPPTCAAAQARVSRKTHMARRHNTTHADVLRGVVRCGPGPLACLGRTLPPGDHDDRCRGRTEALRAARGERCTARLAPARALDDVVWQALGRILTEPALITHEWARAHGGAWLPQALQARRKTLREALTHLERPPARRLEGNLAAILGRAEVERTRQEGRRTQDGLTQPLRQIEAQTQPPVEITARAHGLEACCQRRQPTWDQLTFAHRRPRGARLIDHVIVTHDQVEIRSVVPTGPKGDTTPFDHVRVDDLHRPSLKIQADDRGGAPVHPVRHQHHRAACQCLVLKAHHDPHLAQAGEADGPREAPIRVLGRR